MRMPSAVSQGQRGHTHTVRRSPREHSIAATLKLVEMATATEENEEEEEEEEEKEEEKKEEEEKEEEKEGEEVNYQPQRKVPRKRPNAIRAGASATSRWAMVLRNSAGVSGRRMPSAVSQGRRGHPSSTKISVDTATLVVDKRRTTPEVNRGASTKRQEGAGNVVDTQMMSSRERSGVSDVAYTESNATRKVRHSLRRHSAAARQKLPEIATATEEEEEEEEKRDYQQQHKMVRRQAKESADRAPVTSGHSMTTRKLNRGSSSSRVAAASELPRRRRSRSASRNTLETILKRLRLLQERGVDKTL